MSIRDAGRISGSGKEIYGEMWQRIVVPEFLSSKKEPLSQKDFDKLLKKYNINMKFFDILKNAIYNKDKKLQKLGWEMYHNLPSKEQKEFKSEIKAEEKARKAK